MSNDTQVKQADRIPKRIWVEEVWITDAIQVHYNPTRKAPKKGFCEYVRADLLATVRREAFDAAGQIAFAEAVRQGISAQRAIAIKSKIEASASKKGEMNG